MIRPILKYGNLLLREKGAAVEKEHPLLPDLIDDMWDTLDNAGGVGLAAPQVGVSLQLFLVDSLTTYTALSAAEKQRFTQDRGIRQVFINARILEKGGARWVENEGCLSIPGLSADVIRPSQITLHYFDEHFQEHRQVFDGPNARIIQHELDHTQGILYLDHLNPLKRKLMKGKLQNVTLGRVKTSYPMQ